jgi:hypothetical protein
LIRNTFVGIYKSAASDANGKAEHTKKVDFRPGRHTMAIPFESLFPAFRRTAKGWFEVFHSHDKSADPALFAARFSEAMLIAHDDR